VRARARDARGERVRTYVREHERVSVKKKEWEDSQWRGAS